MQFLYNIVISPIESIIEFIFCFTLDKFDKLGVTGAIIAVSLIVNFLALPIYNVADKIQLKERNIQKKMAYRIAQIKKTFKGDEQFMMLSEYYRQNNYHPLYTLRQSLSILIEIPFFIAAYHFLSNCPLLENQSILLLKDLSKPDALIHFNNNGGGNTFSFSINILPVLMTVINIISSFIYTKDAPLREKIQTNTLAIIFLIILYNSPSGLVFYWILNNIFSLAKNITLKMKKPKKIVHIFLSLILIFTSLYLLILKDDNFSKTNCIYYLVTIIFITAPSTIKFLKSKNIYNKIKNIKISNENLYKQNFILLLLSCISLFILCGLFLPANVIATSPSEFSYLGKTASPLSYIYSSISYFAGLFIFWPLVILKLFNENKKVIFFMPLLFFLLAICSLANAFLFKFNYGLLSLLFTFDNEDILTKKSFFVVVLPLLFFLMVSFIFLFLQKKKFIINTFIIAIIVAQLFISVKKIKVLD